MIRGLISIFALPQEIDDLHLTLYNLKKNVSRAKLGQIEFDIDLTFCVSDELTDWEASKLHKEYFIEKFNALLPLIDWADSPRVRIEDGNEILGCVSQRRYSLSRMNDFDFVIWLDCDMVFDSDALLMMGSAYRIIFESGYQNCVITPSFVRQWDSSWDGIVDDRFKNHELMYHEAADIITDSLPVEGVQPQIFPVQEFKFAGGWLTLISVPLLRIIGVPDELGHYGLEDTYITTLCNYMKQKVHPSNPQQARVNCIVGENYKYRCNSHLKNMVISKGRKEEFRKVATDNFGPLVSDFMKKVDENDI